MDGWIRTRLKTLALSRALGAPDPARSIPGKAPILPSSAGADGPAAPPAPPPPDEQPALGG
jgi:hypothetical protein